MNIMRFISRFILKITALPQPTIIYSFLFNANFYLTIFSMLQFAEQLNEIVKECPEGRQTLLFSATLPKMLIQFTRAGLRDPQLIRLDTDIKMSDELRLAFFSLRSNEKVS